MRATAFIEITAPSQKLLPTKEIVTQFFVDKDFSCLPSFSETHQSDPEVPSMSFEISSGEIIPWNIYSDFIKDYPSITIDVHNEFYDEWWDHIMLSADGAYSVFDKSDLDWKLRCFIQDLYDFPGHYDIDKAISMAYFMTHDIHKMTRRLDVDKAEWVRGESISLQEEDVFNMITQPFLNHPELLPELKTKVHEFLRKIKEELSTLEWESDLRRKACSKTDDDELSF